MAEKNIANQDGEYRGALLRERLQASKAGVNAVGGRMDAAMKLGGGAGGAAGAMALAAGGNVGDAAKQVVKTQAKRLFLRGMLWAVGGLVAFGPIGWLILALLLPLILAAILGYMIMKAINQGFSQSQA